MKTKILIFSLLTLCIGVFIFCIIKKDDADEAFDKVYLSKGGHIACVLPNSQSVIVSENDGGFSVICYGENVELSFEVKKNGQSNFIGSIINNDGEEIHVADTNGDFIPDYQISPKGGRMKFDFRLVPRDSGSDE